MGHSSAELCALKTGVEGIWERYNAKFYYFYNSLIWRIAKEQKHYNLQIGINFCVFILTLFSLNLQGFHKSAFGWHMTIDVNMNTGKLENKNSDFKIFQCRMWDNRKIETLLKIETSFCQDFDFLTGKTCFESWLLRGENKRY